MYIDIPRSDGRRRRPGLNVYLRFTQNAHAASPSLIHMPPITCFRAHHLTAHIKSGAFKPVIPCVMLQYVLLTKLSFEVMDVSSIAAILSSRHLLTDAYELMIGRGGLCHPAHYTRPAHGF